MHKIDGDNRGGDLPKAPGPYGTRTILRIIYKIFYMYLHLGKKALVQNYEQGKIAFKFHLSFG